MYARRVELAANADGLNQTRKAVSRAYKTRPTLLREERWRQAGAEGGNASRASDHAVVGKLQAGSGSGKEEDRCGCVKKLELVRRWVNRWAQTASGRLTVEDTPSDRKDRAASGAEKHRLRRSIGGRDRGRMILSIGASERRRIRHAHMPVHASASERQRDEDEQKWVAETGFAQSPECVKVIAMLTSQLQLYCSCCNFTTRAAGKCHARTHASCVRLCSG